MASQKWSERDESATVEATDESLLIRAGNNLRFKMSALSTWLGATFAPLSRLISTRRSLQGGGSLAGDRTLELVGDVDAPGNNKVYGTDGTGARGWKDDPAGGPGGGIGRGTRYVAGELAVAENDGAGTETIQTLLSPTVTDITDHIGSTENPHGVTAAQAGADPAGSAADVQTNLDSHIGSGGGAHADVVSDGDAGFMTGTDKLKLDNIEANANFGLKNVVEDLSPELGGDIKSLNRLYRMTDGQGNTQGILGWDGATTVGFLGAVELADLANPISQAVVAGTSASLRANGPGGGDALAESDSGQVRLRTNGVDRLKVTNAGEVRLGDDMQTAGNYIDVWDEDPATTGKLVGSFGHMPPAYNVDGVYIARHDGDDFDPTDGAFAAITGSARIYGNNVNLQALQHSLPEGMQVMVNEAGDLFAIERPPPGWSDIDTDISPYPRVGIAVGTWQRLTALNVTTQQDVQAGGVIDVQAYIYTVNGASNQNGTVEVQMVEGVSAPPGAGTPFPIVNGAVGYMNYSTRLVAGALVPAGTTISVWVRVTQQSNAQFTSNLVFDGGTGPDLEHVAYAGVAGEGGAGATTFVGLVDTPNSYLGQNNKWLKVNNDANALEFTDAPTGSGDVVGPDGGVVDNEIAVYNQATGKLIKGSDGLLYTTVQNHINNTGEDHVPAGSADQVLRRATADGALEFALLEGKNLTVNAWSLVGRNASSSGPMSRIFPSTLTGRTGGTDAKLLGWNSADQLGYFDWDDLPGANNPPSTKGDIWTYIGGVTDAQGVIGVGPDNYVLMADDTPDAGIAWKQVIGDSIADTTITGGKLVNGTISVTQMGNNSVGKDQLVNGSVDETKLKDFGASQFLLHDAASGSADPQLKGIHQLDSALGTADDTDQLFIADADDGNRLKRVTRGVLTAGFTSKTSGDENDMVAFGTGNTVVDAGFTAAETVNSATGGWNLPNTQGDLWMYAGGGYSRLPIGVQGEALVVGPAGIPEWGTVAPIFAKLRYVYDATVGLALPAVGEFRMNAAGFDLTTGIAYNDTDADGGSVRESLLDLTPGDELFIEQDDDPDRIVVYSVVSTVAQPGWVQVNVSFVRRGSNNFFVDNSSCTSSFLDLDGSAGDMRSPIPDMQTGELYATTNTDGDQTRVTGVTVDDITGNLKVGTRASGADIQVAAAFGDYSIVYTAPYESGAAAPFVNVGDGNFAPVQEFTTSGSLTINAPVANVGDAIVIIRNGNNTVNLANFTVVHGEPPVDPVNDPDRPLRTANYVRRYSDGATHWHWGS